MSIEEVLEDVKRHLDYVEATKQMSIRDNQMKEMYEEIERLKNIIKEKEKDFELLRKAQLKKCQEYENLEKLNNANYQSFIEVNNIIIELEKYFNEQVDYMTHHSIERMVAFDCCRHKLQELKGSDKDCINS